MAMHIETLWAHVGDKVYPCISAEKKGNVIYAECQEVQHLMRHNGLMGRFSGPTLNTLFDEGETGKPKLFPTLVTVTRIVDFVSQDDK